MKANEFVIEGPLDDAGDWMQGQVIGRKQADQAKARKQNMPKIIKAVTEVLVMKVNELATRAKEANKQIGTDEITSVVFGTLRKMLKIDPAAADYKDMATELVASAQDPAGFASDVSVRENIKAIVEMATAPDAANKDEFQPTKAQVYRPATNKNVVITLINGEYALLNKVAGEGLYELKGEVNARITKEQMEVFIAKDGQTQNKPDNTGIFINASLTPIHTKSGNKVFRITPE